MHEAHMSSYQQYYEQTYRSESLDKDRLRVNRLAFLLPDGLHGKRILDVGCGPGVQFLKHVASNEVHGVDISQYALEEAAKNGLIPHQVTLGDEPLPFGDNSFDIVIATDIFEHLFDPLALLFEIKRVMKDDALLIASVPNHFLWWMLIRMMLNKGLVLPYHTDQPWNYCHLRFFTSHSFDAFLSAGGMRVVKKHYDAFPSFHWFIPHFLRPKLMTYFPDKFAFHFLVEAVKASTTSVNSI
jgi:SAM-dependent methyltransferase